MRIYRDTRFSKDKTPYKTNVGISVRHQADGNIHAPGVYVHLQPGECMIGAGCWKPERSLLNAVRAAIDDHPAAWKRARDNKAFRSEFDFVGESLKKAPRDYPADHPMIEDLRRVDYMAVAPLTDAQVTGEKIISILIDRIKKAKPLMKFICDSIEIPY